MPSLNLSEPEGVYLGLSKPAVELVRSRQETAENSDLVLLNYFTTFSLISEPFLLNIPLSVVESNMLVNYI